MLMGNFLRTGGVSKVTVFFSQIQQKQKSDPNFCKTASVYLFFASCLMPCWDFNVYMRLFLAFLLNKPRADKIWVFYCRNKQLKLHFCPFGNIKIKRKSGLRGIMHASHHFSPFVKVPDDLLITKNYFKISFVRCRPWLLTTCVIDVINHTHTHSTLAYSRHMCINDERCIDL